MSAPRPLYVLGRASAARDAVLAVLPVSPTATFDSVAQLVADGSTEPGVVVLVRGALPPDEVVESLVALGRGRGEWVPLLTGLEEGAPVLRAVSVGYAHDAPAVAGLVHGSDPSVFLELRRALAEVARARHDINNPLTSGMAETQLLLMDLPGEGELRSSLETIQAQFRRIRDLVAATGHLRPGTD